MTDYVLYTCNKAVVSYDKNVVSQYYYIIIITNICFGKENILIRQGKEPLDQSFLPFELTKNMTAGSVVHTRYFVVAS